MQEENMKRILMVAFALIVAVMMMACGAETPDVQPTPTPTSTPAPTPTPTPSPTPTPVPTPTGPVSYTTGLPFDGAYKPVMVVIENSVPARPQTGLQTADVVYEVPVEGSITRFVCVFSDNVPEGVMR